jgi:hypothetical protein
MTDEASISRSTAAWISVQAHTHGVGVKARGAGRSKNQRIIEAGFQGYLS